MGKYFFLLMSLCVFKAEIKAIQLDSNLKLSIYNDIFYQNDFNYSLNNINRLPFLFNHNRTNTIAINQALISLTYEKERVRSTIALQAGTYANDNYRQDSNYKNIFEANFGFAVGKKKKLWIDAGILPSYIGFETAISSKNLTLSRSLSAENSPYYMMGAYATYQLNKQWMVRGIVSNGWQQIVKLPSSWLGLGLQIKYTKNKTTLNYSNYFNDQATMPKIFSAPRFFNNLYLEQDWKKWSLRAGFDIGVQEEGFFIRRKQYWHTGTLIGRYKINEKFKLGGRLEYFSDINTVVIDYNLPFQAYGTSLNLDYNYNKNVLLRLEPRLLLVHRNINGLVGGVVDELPSFMFSFAFILP